MHWFYISKLLQLQNTCLESGLSVKFLNIISGNLVPYGAPFVNLLSRPIVRHFSIIYKQLKVTWNLFINKECMHVFIQKLFTYHELKVGVKLYDLQIMKVYLAIIYKE